MPTYEYRCKDCGHELEAVQAFTDDPLTECPSCGGNLKKRFGTVGISFKGSGFYKNDSRSSTSGAGSSSNSSGSTGSTTSTTSTDSATGDSATGSSGSGSTSDTKKEAASA